LGFEFDLQFVTYSPGAIAFVLFVPEAFFFQYVGVWAASIEFLAVGTIILLLFLCLLCACFIRVFCFATLFFALGFAAFGVDA
jgi:hypothetical protein